MCLTINREKKKGIKLKNTKRHLEQNRQVQRRLNRVGERESERHNIYFFPLLNFKIIIHSFVV